MPIITGLYARKICCFVTHKTSGPYSNWVLKSPPTKFDRPQRWKYCRDKLRKFTNEAASGDEILELIFMFILFYNEEYKLARNKTQK